MIVVVLVVGDQVWGQGQVAGTQAKVREIIIVRTVSINQHQQQQDERR